MLSYLWYVSNLFKIFEKGAIHNALIQLNNAKNDFILLIKIWKRAYFILQINRYIKSTFKESILI
jgi:hypothetical protein